jgi:hypothetical protein
MNFLLPPSGQSLRSNARLLAAEWQAAGALARYFIASQLLSGLLLGLCALGSIAAGIAGLTVTYLGLLATASLCAVHTFATWHVLKTRFRVRYEVW